jgi:hypothetical protein
MKLSSSFHFGLTPPCHPSMNAASKPHGLLQAYRFGINYLPAVMTAGLGTMLFVEGCSLAKFRELDAAQLQMEKNSKFAWAADCLGNLTTIGAFSYLVSRSLNFLGL